MAHIPTSQALVSDICDLIDQAKSQIAKTINQEMTLLYWQIGKRIKEEVVKSERADYGEQIIHNLANQLTTEYGRGFGKRILFRAIQFYENFSEFKKVSTLSTLLTWSHFVELLPIKDPLKRDFYAEMCRIDRWSVRTLREKIGKLLYERTALSRQPEEIIKDSLSLIQEQDRLTTNMILQDPYILDCLNLPSNYSESELEGAILSEIQRFLLDIGVGFCFVARQKRISVGKKDYWIDLLLYNRYLRKLVVIELKNTAFKPEHKGQMEFYLKWLDKNERRGDDDHPIGIILCTEKDHEQIQVFDLDNSGIHVAEYWTELPPKEIFEKKIQDIIEESKERIALSSHRDQN